MEYKIDVNVDAYTHYYKYGLIPYYRYTYAGIIDSHYQSDYGVRWFEDFNMVIY